MEYGVGFKDGSHFARLFRARYGQSPRSWTRVFQWRIAPQTNSP